MRENKMMLSEAEAKAVAQAQPAAAERLLGIPNVVGVGTGVKWTDGQPTGKPAFVVLVTHKVPQEDLDKASLIPAKVQATPTDVLAIGHLFASDEDPILEDDEDPILEDDEDPILEDDEAPILEEGTQDRRKKAALKRKRKAQLYRVRPVSGGYSVGHRKVTAGTVGACVYDQLPGGAGAPGKYYILSNNHILANRNLAGIGAPILQPGVYDGGQFPRDRIGRLSRFIPIQFAPDVPLAAQHNLVDAAIAEVPFRLLNPSLRWIGEVRGWQPKAAVTVGTLVKKTGRTTNFTTGRILVINATVDVNYRGGKVARLKEQIITTKMSAGGDSGSLITTPDNVAVGLLFAGSTEVTVANLIENVRSLLRVELV